MTLFAFPMEQIGQGLRRLSLSGTIGNIIAIICYILICVVPILIYLFMKKKQKTVKMDAFLIVLSIYSFVMMYFMINPGLFPSVIPNAAQMMFGSVFYSILCTYFVIRILSSWKKADLTDLQRGLRNFLYFLILLFGVIIIVDCIGGVFTGIEAVRAENSGVDFMDFYNTSSLMPTYILLVAQGIVRALPYIFDIGVTLCTIRTMNELLVDSFSAAAVDAVQKLAGFCVKALECTAFVSLAFNIFQLCFQSMFYKTNFSVELPLFSLVFILAVLILARYVQENQKLKQDNDLFI